MTIASSYKPVDKAKPFKIPKREVWEAFKRVKANQGAAGVDGQSIAEFEANLSGNLYKLWNRLSSGSYFPPPVRRIEIPKANGGTRPLGIPTVADRIAQEVVRRYLEPILEPVFHADSYGYRPGKSAVDAVRTAKNSRAPYLDCAANGIDDASELYEDAVTRPLDDAAVMHGDGGIDQIASQRSEAGKCPLLVGPGKLAESDHVRRKKAASFRVSAMAVPSPHARLARLLIGLYRLWVQHLIQHLLGVARPCAT